MAKTGTALVIVESPAKSKTIEKYLGSGYKVTSSMGHLRDLPKSKLSVDVENGFEPQYVAVKGRESLIKTLKSEAKKASVIYLATDPDREGEAIAWHLKELLEIPDDKALRVTFNEITKKVVTESINKPRAIDQDLVDSQQARRILDRLVGYVLSPLLWKKMRKGLSAGRVQSVATRMVVERERERRAFVPEEYWYLDAFLEDKDKKAEFTARYFGDENGKLKLESEQATQKVIDDVTGKDFVIKSIKSSKKKRSSPPPFITSTLQQEASRLYGMTPRKTMSIAQQLYEGISIKGKDAVGLITYMRTDSLRISEDALNEAEKYIKATYGAEYYYGSHRRFKTKGAAQDAHEAIRPTDIFQSPDIIRKDLSSDQYKVYRLIWSRFAATQMAPSIHDSLQIDNECEGHIFRATLSVLIFKGYTAVYEESSDDEQEKPSKQLPKLSEGQVLTLLKLEKEQKFTEPPQRYTEASLIKALEEKGIGRPSTYAPTISTISSNEYVVKTGKYLEPTMLGETVTETMEEYFPDIVDLKFTEKMELGLDDIELGKLGWRDYLKGFYGDFDSSVKAAEEALEGKRIKIPDEVSEEICPECGKNLVVKHGRFGRFLACPGFPDCNFTMPLVVEMPGRCPKCGSRILKRTSKKGYTFYSCENGTKRAPGTEESETFIPVCDFITWEVPTKDDCPSCGNTLFKNSGRGQRKSFCINPECSAFVPEENRRYKKAEKKEGDDSKKTAAKKKPAAKRSDTGKKKTATAAKKKPTAAKKKPAKSASPKTAE